MKRLFWYFMMALSGGLIGLSLAEFLRQDVGEITIYLFIAGLILAAVSAWGMKKYLGLGFFTNKTKR